MKKLISLLLIIGCVFADEIIFRNVYLQYGKEQVDERIFKGEYLGTLDSKVYIREKNGKPKGHNCIQVISILDNNRKPIEFDCSLNTYTPESITEIDDNIFTNKPVIGGSLIAIGGILLHTYPDDPLCISNECESLNDYKEYTDKKQLQWRSGIILISIGSILVALGI